MATKLDKSIKRELEHQGKLYTITLAPEGVKVASHNESRVMVSARKFAELKTAPLGVEISPLEPVDKAVRAVEVPE